jgi:TPR repeat protein
LIHSIPHEARWLARLLLKSRNTRHEQRVTMRAIDYANSRSQSTEPLAFGPNHGSRLSVRTRIAAALIAAGVVGALFVSHVSHAPRPRDLVLLTQSAKGGDDGAELQLGLAYREGLLGLAPDDVQARYWIHRAALDGNGYAANLEGHAPPPSLAGRARAFLDEIGAVFLRSGSMDRLSTAAQAGDAIAQYQLAMRYREGSWGVARDDAAARLWLERAAKGGNTVAMLTLARAFESGEHGFTRDAEQARLWRDRAAITH